MKAIFKHNKICRSMAGKTEECLMIEKTISEFMADAEKFTLSAIENDDFVKIRTRDGNAVLISEAEWNILRDSLPLVLNAV